MFGHKLPRKLTVVSTQELADTYPELTPKEREDVICREFGLVLLTQIGGALRDGKPHDLRAPDYDDWSLNGDILVWDYTRGHSLELSSMGIRVDADALDRQLTIADKNERRSLPFHKMIFDGVLPFTIGGGIGQSRLCMYFLEKAHIGEVQSSCWPEDMWAECEKIGIHLL